jgi:hypothetical protein
VLAHPSLVAASCSPRAAGPSAMSAARRSRSSRKAIAASRSSNGRRCLDPSGPVQRTRYVTSSMPSRRGRRRVSMLRMSGLLLMPAPWRHGDGGPTSVWRAASACARARQRSTAWVPPPASTTWRSPLAARPRRGGGTARSRRCAAHGASRAGCAGGRSSARYAQFPRPPRRSSGPPATAAAAAARRAGSIGAPLVLAPRIGRRSGRRAGRPRPAGSGRPLDTAARRRVGFVRLPAGPRLAPRGDAASRADEVAEPIGQCGRGVATKPSAGLEPATPSLPWRPLGAGAGMPRAVMSAKSPPEGEIRAVCMEGILPSEPVEPGPLAPVWPRRSSVRSGGRPRVRVQGRERPGRDLRRAWSMPAGCSRGRRAGRRSRASGGRSDSSARRSSLHRRSSARRSRNCTASSATARQSILLISCRESTAVAITPTASCRCVGRIIGCTTTRNSHSALISPTAGDGSGSMH